jgi:hypothetical protein
MSRINFNIVNADDGYIIVSFNASNVGSMMVDLIQHKQTAEAATLDYQTTLEQVVIMRANQSLYMGGHLPLDNDEMYEVFDHIGKVCDYLKSVGEIYESR